MSPRLTTHEPIPEWRAAPGEPVPWSLDDPWGPTGEPSVDEALPRVLRAVQRAALALALMLFGALLAVQCAPREAAAGGELSLTWYDRPWHPAHLPGQPGGLRWESALRVDVPVWRPDLGGPFRLLAHTVVVGGDSFRSQEAGHLEPVAADLGLGLAWSWRRWELRLLGASTHCFATAPQPGADGTCQGDGYNALQLRYRFHTGGR